MPSARRVVGTLAVTETVSWGVLYYAFAVLQVPMRAELDLSPAATAGAFSVAVLSAGLAAVPVGRWLDRRGPRAVMTGGSLAAVLLVLAWSRVGSAVELYVVMAGVGAASAAVLYEPAFAVVIRCSADRGRALLVITLLAGLASTIFLPVTDGLASAVGWRSALVVLAGILAVATVLPHALVLPDRWPQGPASAGAAGTESPAALAGGSTASRVRLVRQDVRLRWLTAGFTLHSAAVVVVTVHLVPLLRESGHSARFAAAAAGSLGLLSVLGRLLHTGAAQRWGVGRSATVAFATQAVGALVLLVGAGTTTGAVAFVVLFGLGFGIGTVARPALLAEGWGPAGFATLSAVVGLALTTAKTAAPLAAGAARTVAPTYAPVVLALAMACGVSAFAVWRGAARRAPLLAATGRDVASSGTLNT